MKETGISDNGDDTEVFFAGRAITSNKQHQDQIAETVTGMNEATSRRDMYRLGKIYV